MSESESLSLSLSISLSLSDFFFAPLFECLSCSFDPSISPAPRYFLAVGSYKHDKVYDANMPVLENSKIESIAGLAPFPPNFLQMSLHSSQNEQAFASIQSALSITSFALCLGKDPRSDGHPEC